MNNILLIRFLCKPPIATFLCEDTLGGDVRLPCRCADITRATRILEHPLHFFQGLAGSFWESKEGVHEHQESKDPEDNVSLPLNVLEGHWSEDTQSRVESPVCACGQGDSLSADS